MNANSTTLAGSCRCALASVSQKQIVALSGLGMAVFVLAHMAGNMLVFISPRAYNEYGHAMISNPVIYAAELGLVAFFIAHAFYATYLTWKNYNARPEKYAMRASGEKRTPWLHRTLFAQGLILLFFVVTHLITFKYGTLYTINYGNGEIRDLFRLMVEVFSNPAAVAWYLVSLAILGAHLSHGVSSTIQSFGLHHPRYTPWLRCFSRVYAAVVALGFISQPIYIYGFYKG